MILKSDASSGLMPQGSEFSGSKGKRLTKSSKAAWYISWVLGHPRVTYIARHCLKTKSKCKAKCGIRKILISVTDRGEEREMTGQALQVLYATTTICYKYCMLQLLYATSTVYDKPFPFIHLDHLVIQTYPLCFLTSSWKYF